jgi:hypothetical protein
MNTADTTFDLGEVGQFQPHAKYHHGLDMVVYLAEDCSYMSEPVDGFLTLLWHPHDVRLVGIKLKGFRYAFFQLQHKLGWKEGDWLPLKCFIETWLTNGLGHEILKSEEAKKKYRLAKDYVAQVGLVSDEVKKITDAA